MRKQVQKERCTKIMLTKCKAVCHLYDKVQLAAAKMLDAEPAIFQFECNVPILCNDIPANDLNLPSETYTTDFVLHYDDGHTLFEFSRSPYQRGRGKYLHGRNASRLAGITTGVPFCAANHRACL